MEEELKEIIKGYEVYKKERKKDWIDRASRGIGTKSYVIKRIDLLREKLLQMKKEIKDE